MLTWLRQLDRILRGEATHMDKLKEGRIEIPVRGIGAVVVILAMVNGLCIGSFAAFRGSTDSLMQLVASGVKLPLLFVLTFMVTFPSLYVFNALIGSRLTVLSTLRLLVVGTAVMVTVAASLGPIVVFFGTSTTSYHFMVLLNVIVGGVAGGLGITFLLRTLHRLVLVQEPAPRIKRAPREEGVSYTEPPEVTKPAALDPVGDVTSRRALLVCRIWLVVFALVGTQMSWVLRPFIGDPGRPFEWFREREGNFFQAVLQTIGELLSW
jgi:hypothetical protein